MLTYQVEILDQNLIAEMAHHQTEYWKEVAKPFHNFPPDVDWNLYLSAQKNGALKVVVGRDKKNTLKAGVFVLITPHPHYACIVASLPLLWLANDARRGLEGIRLIKIAEKTAGEAGAQLIMTHGGIHNRVAKVFEFLGYDDFGRYFVKPLNGPNGTKPIYKGGQ